MSDFFGLTTTTIIIASVFLTGDYLGLLNLEYRTFRALYQHFGERLHVHRHLDRRYSTTAQPTAHRKSKHNVLHISLVGVKGKMEGADARSLDVKRYLAVWQWYTATRAHPSRAYFRYLRESMVTDTMATSTTMTVAARSYSALRHPNLSLSTPLFADADDSSPPKALSPLHRLPPPLSRREKITVCGV